VMTIALGPFASSDLISLATAFPRGPSPSSAAARR
jgi:hypothetical protein